MKIHLTMESMILLDDEEVDISLASIVRCILAAPKVEVEKTSHFPLQCPNKATKKLY